MKRLALHIAVFLGLTVAIDFVVYAIFGLTNNIFDVLDGNPRGTFLAGIEFIFACILVDKIVPMYNKEDNND